MGKKKVSVTRRQVFDNNPLIEAMASPKREAVGSKMTDLPDMKDGMAAEELALAAGVGVKTIRERLKGLMNEGRLAVGRKRSRDLMGRPIWVPCYRIRATK